MVGVMANMIANLEVLPAGEAVHEGGFLVALRDKSGTGKADVIERFGATAQDGVGIPKRMAGM